MLCSPFVPPQLQSPDIIVLSMIIITFSHQCDEYHDHYHLQHQYHHYYHDHLIDQDYHHNFYFLKPLLFLYWLTKDTGTHHNQEEDHHHHHQDEDHHHHYQEEDPHHQ